MDDAHSRAGSLRRLAQRAYYAWQRPRVKQLALGCLLALLVVLDVKGTTGQRLGTQLVHYMGYGYKVSNWRPAARPLPSETLSGARGDAVAWPGDAAFWRMLPCDRSEYQVVLASNASAADECGATVVSGWFDIGRGSWSNFRRSNADYMANMRTVMTLRNPMVMFTTPEFTEEIIALRAAHGLMDRTTLVTMSSLLCSPVAHLDAPARSIMGKREYLQGYKEPEVPQATQVWYNLLMWLKAYLFKAASLLPQTASEYYVWLGAWGWEEGRAGGREGGGGARGVCGWVCVCHPRIASAWHAPKTRVRAPMPLSSPCARPPPPPPPPGGPPAPADGGCHPPMCQRSMEGMCLQPRRWARADRIRIAQKEVLTPAQVAMGPAVYYKRDLVHFIGTIWGIGRAHVDRLFDLFTDTVRWMMAQGVVDQDQTVFTFMYLRDPAAFDA